MTDMMKERFLTKVIRPGHNYIFVKNIDNYFKRYLKEHGGNVIYRTTNLLECELYGEQWTVMKLTKNNARGCKPRKLILDNRLDDELIEESGIMYNMIVCVYGEVF